MATIQKAADEYKTLRTVKGGLFHAVLCFLLVGPAACSNVFLGGGSGGDGAGASPGRILTVSLSGDNLVKVNSTLPVSRTMLPSKPVFTRYQLVFTSNLGDPFQPGDLNYHPPVDFFNSTVHIPLDDGSYYFIVQGYVGDAVAAKSAVSAAVNVSGGGTVVSPGSLSFSLEPYEAPEEKGTLTFSLSWEGLNRMPGRAELQISANSPGAPDQWNPIEAEYILGAGLARTEAEGTILLLRNDGVSEVYSALSGAIGLPPGEYKLVVSLMLDGSLVSSDFDIAHIYSNLTTPAAFYYGAGRFTTINEAADPGAPFITGFEFEEVRGTTVIGSTADADGTRLIMVMVPPGTDLTRLTPLVTTAPGSFITFPVAASVMGGGSGYAQGEINFITPSSWTVQSAGGAVQRYTVIVSESAANTSNITYFSFDEYPEHPGVIDQAAGTINITLPPGANPGSLTPDVFFMGKNVVHVDGSSNETDLNASPSPSFDFSSPQTFRVYDNSGGGYKDYTVTAGVALDTDASITQFTIDGYSGISFTIDPLPVVGTITGTLPYGVSLAHLTPIIQYKGKSLSPPSRQGQDFRAPVYYTVIAEDGSTTKSYQVILGNKPADTNTRISGFSIANVKGCEILIGTNPRAGDGKIPIVVQVPYGINIGSFIPAITLESSTSTIAPDGSLDAEGGLGFGEHSYTVTAQAGNTQQYAVTISGKGESYYVNGNTGIDDIDPSAGSQARPFKTLAWAVDKTANHPVINRIVVSGELNNTTEGGAWEDNDASPTGFHASGSGTSSVFTLYGTRGKQITISGGTLRGVSGKRVLYAAGSADLVFENTIITGGNLPGASLGIGGGGIYITGGSKVRFSGGSISNNSAPNGGGVYLEDSGNAENFFTLMGGSIISNNATLKTGWAGGGGVSVNGRSTFWMASGTIANNTAAQDGAAVQVYGRFGGFGPSDTNYGFIMSGGVITGNRGLYCGGVYVSSGAFEMTGGEICLNRTNAATNGAGLYALLRGSTGIVVNIRGSASINNNTSDFAENKEAGTAYQSNRNIAFTIGENARINTAYVDITGIPGNPGTGFNLEENARLGTIFLNYNANPPVVVDLLNTDTLTDQIAIIDLTGTLANWVGKTILTGANTELHQVVNNGRFRLYNNGKDITAAYHLAVSGTTAVLRAR
ncbi:MAG: hypothetical protein LBO80_08570 [Treponema sp.]|jgi:hypothetical protein|nr:hypothetical protein [Treponema sp.]